MHNLYFVITSDELKLRPQTVMLRVEEILEDNHFVGSGKLWGYGKCDNYAIGGHWSGQLSYLTWAKEAVTKIRQLEIEHRITINGVYYGEQAKRDKQSNLKKQAEAIWNRYKPDVYKNTTYFRDPFLRSTHGKRPQDDDAMIVTPELWQALQDFHSNIEVLVVDDLKETVIGNLSEIDVIGKWITVIDYHD